MEKLVGLLAPARMFVEPNPRRDEYYFGNNYSNRIYDLGATPLGILPSDGHVSEKVLDRFDSFLLLGGHQFWPYHFQVMEHALKNEKPLLGICLGMQTICMYFKMKEMMAEQGVTGDMCEFYYSLRPTMDTMAQPPMGRVEGHLKEHIRGHEDDTKHPVLLTPGSHIHRLLGADTIQAGTFHSFCICNPSPSIAVTGRAEDGTIEVVEYGEKILGVQFHPEIDRKLMPIFDILVK